MTILASATTIWPAPSRLQYRTGRSVRIRHTASTWCPAEIFVVPKGTERKPSSPGGSISIFEPHGTLTTGDRHQDGIPAHIDSTAGLDISG